MKRQNRSASLEGALPANDDGTFVAPVAVVVPDEPALDEPSLDEQSAVRSVDRPVPVVEADEPDPASELISERTVPAWAVVRRGSGFARVRLALTPLDLERLAVREHAPDIRGVVIGHLMIEIDREMK